MHMAAMLLAASLLLAADGTSAQDLPALRLRVGAGIGLGPLIVPHSKTLAAAEASGRIGVQANDQLALYLHPAFTIGVGSANVVLFDAGITAEWVPVDWLAIGAAPEVAYFVTLNAGDGTSNGPRGPAGGAHAHFAYYPAYGIGYHYPYNGRPTNLTNRAAYSFSLDVLVLAGSIGGFGPQPAKRDFLMVLPTLSVGADAY